MKLIINYLLISICYISIAFGQQNLVMDGSFDNSILIEYQKKESILKKSEWYSFSGTKNGDEKAIVGDEHQGTVVSYTTQSVVSILNSYVGQYINNVSVSGIYQVGFYARSMIPNHQPTISISLRILNELSGHRFYSLIQNGKTANMPIAQIKLTNDWGYYTVDFDLSKVIVTDDNFSVQKTDKSTLTNSRSVDFQNLCLAFSVSTPNSQLRFTDISMKLME